MSIDTIKSQVNHVKSTLKKLQSSKELPFTDVLSQISINEKISELDYRDRVFTPDLTVFALLSQVTGMDQSCQMAVT